MLKRILIVAAMALLLCASVSANAANTVVQVTGNGQLEVAPDEAWVQLSVVSVHASLDEAKNINTLASGRVLAAFKQQGLLADNIKTGSYQISPVYQDEKNRVAVLKGYRVVQTFEAGASPERIGLLIHAATQAGANEVGDIRFETSKQAELKNQVLRDAVQNAMEKARVIAAAVNKKVGAITQVSESNVYYQPTLRMKSAMMDEADSSLIPVIPAGTVNVRATVQVTVELE